MVSSDLIANDGVFYATGNHLIPIQESEISVKKEVLTIKRINRDYIEVNVEYEFYNPNKEKTILVGFEAPSPSGDVDGTPVNGKHPYIHDFSVIINSIPIPFKSAIVTDSLYYQNGMISGKKESEVITPDFNENDPSFYYVCYFNASFKQGTNFISHKYRFQLSGSVMEEYSFDYILTAANRWANQQIDDFTLIIDMGEFQNFNIPNSFFDTKSEWSVNGHTKDIEPTIYFFSDKPVTNFLVKRGLITFKKKNFAPKGELRVFAPRDYKILDIKDFDYAIHDLPYPIDYSLHVTNTIDERSLKILRNLPYARRGYIFKTSEIQQYYESMDWYHPDSTYKASLDNLTKAELDWIEKLKVSNNKK